MKKSLTLLSFVISVIYAQASFLGGELTSRWNENNLEVKLSYFFSNRDEAPENSKILVKDDSQIIRGEGIANQTEVETLKLDYPINCNPSFEFYKVSYTISFDNLSEYEGLKIMNETPEVSVHTESTIDLYNSNIALVIAAPLKKVNQFPTLDFTPPVFSCGGLISYQIKKSCQIFDANYSFLPVYLSYLNEEKINPLGTDYGPVNWQNSFSYENPFGNNNAKIDLATNTVELAPTKGAFVVSDGIVFKNKKLTSRVYLIENQNFETPPNK